MRTPVRFWRSRLTYTGRVAREPFVTWTESGRGRSVIELAAPRMRFALFGRLRAARRRVWRQVVDAARTEAVMVAVQRELDAYLPRVDTLAYARGLPCVGVDLHRLVVVPRLFANAEVSRRIDAALTRLQVFAAIDGGEWLRRWFVQSLVDAIEAAAKGARPSLGRPLPAGRDWIIVGVDEQFEWGVPIEGSGWPGHYYVLEVTRTRITRAVRKAAAEALGRLEMSLRSLSRLQRNDILRQAGASLEQMSVRA